MIGPFEWKTRLHASAVDVAAPGLLVVQEADRRWLSPLRDRLAASGIPFPGNRSPSDREALGFSDTGALSQDLPWQEQLAAAQNEIEEWRQQCEWLQVQLTLAEERRSRLEHRLQQAAADVQTASLLIPQAPSLLVEELVTANWIGEIGASSGVVHPIISVGSREGIARQELVLDAALPHLDRGSAAGIEPESIVLAGRRLVGRTVQTGYWTSTVQPITDAEFRLPVQLLRTAGSQGLLGPKGVLAGQGDGRCRLTYIDARQPVLVGDLVVTPPDQEWFPGLLICGRVTHTELREGELEWRITVEPTLRLDELSTVSVVRRRFRDPRDSFTR